MRAIEISEKESEQRLDKFLMKYINKSPKSFIYRMIRKKNITLNGKKADGSEFLKTGDVIQMYLSEDTLGKFSCEIRVSLTAGPLNIVFEDENVLVCNKPAGVLSQHGKASDTDAVTDRIIKYLYDTGQFMPGETFTPAVCNRLDRNTSGLIICGKNLHAAQALSKALSKGVIEKYYLAAVTGKVDDKRTLKGYLFKDRSKNSVKILDYNKNCDGKQVKTMIEPIEPGAFVLANDLVTGSDDYTILCVRLLTGRKHQIRAHLQSIGHPVIGDKKYGGPVYPNLEHYLLHAYKLHFRMNDGVLAYLDNKIITALPDWVIVN